MRLWGVPMLRFPLVGSRTRVYPGSRTWMLPGSSERNCGKRPFEIAAPAGPRATIPTAVTVTRASQATRTRSQGRKEVPGGECTRRVLMPRVSGWADVGDADVVSQPDAHVALEEDFAVLAEDRLHLRELEHGVVGGDDDLRIELFHACRHLAVLPEK